MLFKHNLYYGRMFSADGNGGGGGADTSGNDTGSEGNDAGSDGGNEAEGDETAGLKSALEKERKAAREAARQLKSIQAELDALKNAGKSDEEKRDADLKAALDRAAAAEEKAQRTSGQAAIFKAAAESLSPEAVYALAKDQLEFDDDANPTNVDDVIEQVRKSNPKLFPAARGSADGGKGGESRYEPLPGTDRMRHAYEQSSKAAKR